MLHRLRDNADVMLDRVGETVMTEPTTQDIEKARRILQGQQDIVTTQDCIEHYHFQVANLKRLKLVAKKFHASRVALAEAATNFHRGSSFRKGRK